MKKYFTKKKIAFTLIATLIVIQFFPIDKSVKPTDPLTDYIALTNSTDEVSSILKNACYDCHSSQSNFPWYTNIAPVSWWTKNHINEGRKELNFSDWGTYSVKRKDHKLEECFEMIEEGEMPLNSYTWIHKEAKLSNSQKQLLVDWLKAERTKLNYVGEE